MLAQEALPASPGGVPRRPERRTELGAPLRRPRWFEAKDHVANAPEKRSALSSSPFFFLQDDFAILTA
jgi:hypothetical protein